MMERTDWLVPMIQEFLKINHWKHQFSRMILEKPLIEQEIDD